MLHKASPGTKRGYLSLLLFQAHRAYCICISASNVKYMNTHAASIGFYLNTILSDHTKRTNTHPRHSYPSTYDTIRCLCRSINPVYPTLTLATPQNSLYRTPPPPPPIHPFILRDSQNARPSSPPPSSPPASPAHSPPVKSEASLSRPNSPSPSSSSSSSSYPPTSSPSSTQPPHREVYTPTSCPRDKSPRASAPPPRHRGTPGIFSTASRRCGRPRCCRAFLAGCLL